jgi:multisubunit Na+/H+ antiporter MnhC subunit
MVILGLLLLAAAVVAGTEMTISNYGPDVSFEVFGLGFGAPLATVFLLGAITMAVATLGTFLVTGALQRRREVRTTGKHRATIEETQTRLGDVERENVELAEENERLRTELADRQRAEATMGGVAVPPGVGNVAYGDQISDAVRSETITDTGRFDPYPTDHGTTDGGAVNTEADRFDGERTDDKAGVLGRFRGNH